MIDLAKPEMEVLRSRAHKDFGPDSCRCPPR